MNNHKIDLTSHVIEELSSEKGNALRYLFGAGKDVHFQVTSKGQLAMEHLFFQFYLNNVRQNGKNHFLATTIEEMPILKSLEQMEMMGCGVKLLPVDKNGQIDLEALKEAIGPKTALLSISAVCALTGVVQPVAEIIEICREKGVKIHVSATQAIGSWGVSLKEWDADCLSFDGSVFGGLFSKEPIVGSSLGGEALVQDMQDKTKNQEQFAMEAARLKSTFEEELLRAIPDCIVIGQEVERAPHIFAVSFPGIMNEALMYALHRQNIEVSIGGGTTQSLREILQKCGYTDEVAFSALSFSITPHLQEDELAEALDKIVSCVRKLKKMSVML